MDTRTGSPWVVKVRLPQLQLVCRVVMIVDLIYVMTVDGTHFDLQGQPAAGGEITPRNEKVPDTFNFPTGC